MPKARRSRRTITTVVVLVLVSITIITIDQSNQTHHLTSGVKSLAADVFNPVRGAVDDVIRPVGDFFAGIANYGSLEEENHKLQHELGQLREEANAQPYADHQLQELAALEHLPYLGDLPTVTAQTTAVDASNFAATIDIDKGRDDGVAVGMPVVGTGGLVGQVVEASHTSAVVRLLTDGQTKVGVVFGARDILATVDGEGPGVPLSADFVPTGTAITRGERVFTNGLQSSEYPPGIPVAAVSSWHQVSGATQLSITMAPLADLDQLAYVDVVQWQTPP